MKTYLSILVLTLISLPVASASPVALSVVEGTVTKVSDGDTVKVKTADQTVLTIRMSGMDAPELHLPTIGKGIVKQEYFGEAAAEQLNLLIPVGTQVTVLSYGKDRYDRTLARIFRGEMDVNLEMVRLGWGAIYTVCGKDECGPDYGKAYNVQAYIDACREASQAGRGIFNPARPLLEMPFEFRLRMGEREPDKYVGDFTTLALVRPRDYQKIGFCERVYFMRLSDAEDLGYRLTADQF